jgi:hypothetical protein
MREYNIFRWYRFGWGRYTQSDPIGLDGGWNLFAYANDNPVRAIDPLGLKTCVIFTRDVAGGVTYTSHTAIWSDGKCNGNGGCSNVNQYLYDPAGSYRSRERGSSAFVIDDEGGSLDDYVQYQRKLGSTVEIYCFDTSCCEEQQIYKRADQIGDPRGFSCARSVSACLSGVGPFAGVTKTQFPGVCRSQVMNARRRTASATGGGGGGW